MIYEAFGLNEKTRMFVSARCFYDFHHFFHSRSLILRAAKRTEEAPPNIHVIFIALVAQGDKECDERRGLPFSTIAHIPCAAWQIRHG